MKIFRRYLSTNTQNNNRKGTMLLKVFDDGEELQWVSYGVFYWLFTEEVKCDIYILSTKFVTISFGALYLHSFSNVKTI